MKVKETPIIILVSVLETLLITISTIGVIIGRFNIEEFLFYLLVFNMLTLLKIVIINIFGGD